MKLTEKIDKHLSSSTGRTMYTHTEMVDMLLDIRNEAVTLEESLEILSDPEAMGAIAEAEAEAEETPDGYWNKGGLL